MQAGPRVGEVGLVIHVVAHDTLPFVSCFLARLFVQIRLPLDAHCLVVTTNGYDTRDRFEASVDEPRSARSVSEHVVAAVSQINQLTWGG